MGHLTGRSLAFLIISIVSLRMAPPTMAVTETEHAHTPLQEAISNTQTKSKDSDLKSNTSPQASTEGSAIQKIQLKPVPVSAISMWLTLLKPILDKPMILFGPGADERFPCFGSMNFKSCRLINYRDSFYSIDRQTLEKET